VARRRDDIREALRRRVMGGVHLGLLHFGQRLGTARSIARDIGTDYRVVVAAAHELERDGLLEVRPRTGIFISRQIDHCASGTLTGLGARLVELLVEEVCSGLPALGLAERVRRCLATVRLSAACIECNRDQIDFLCRELRDQYGLETAGVEVDRLRGRCPLPVREADLLVSTSFHAGEVRRCAERLSKPYVLVTVDEDWRSELVRLLSERPVYFVGTDPRWAAKVRVIWGGVAAASNLRPVTLGIDSLAGIPEEAALMVMPSARSLLSERLLERALPPRGLSRESAREILRLVLNANADA